MGVTNYFKVTTDRMTWFFTFDGRNVDDTEAALAQARARMTEHAVVGKMPPSLSVWRRDLAPHLDAHMLEVGERDLVRVAAQRYRDEERMRKWGHLSRREDY